MKQCVYVGGTFDLFHPGHVNLLRKARDYGFVVASLNQDDFAARYKRRPVMTLDERFKVVQACRWVDYAIVNIGDEDSSSTIKWFHRVYTDCQIRRIAHGDDWVGESLKKQMGLDQRWLDDNGISLLYIPYTKGVSSSEIAQRIPHPEVTTWVD